VAVSLNDVRHIATLARLGLSDDRARALMAELNGILAHMEVLSKVDTSGIEPLTGIDAAPATWRADVGPAIPLERTLDTFAPQTRDGFLLVPRLSTHEDPEAAS
jgi:aspartyl-tRNA(Asn)/glutamyl-tRNA(Gln) amidotransferase subunit C